MSAVVIVVTWSVHHQHYQVEGGANGRFASAVGNTYEQDLSNWREKTGYFGEVKK